MTIMILRTFLPMLLTLTLVGSCKDRQPAAAGGANDTDPAPGTQADPALGGSAASDSLVLFFERTPCFGPCKAYRINLYRSGHATFEGRAHVEKEGMHVGRVGPDTLLAIVRRAEQIGFWGLEASYDSPVTDLPSTRIRVVSGRNDKEVTGRVGTPPKFIAFAEYLDELLLPVAWKPMAPQE